jgi:hypothetical protein
LGSEIESLETWNQRVESAVLPRQGGENIIGWIMADNEWKPVTIERGGNLHEGSYNIEGDNVAVMYNGRTKRVELGGISAEALARIVLGEMIYEG